MNRFYIASLIAAFSIAPATANAADITAAAKVQTAPSNNLLNGTSHIAINGVLDDRSFQRRSGRSGNARSNRGNRSQAQSNRGNRNQAQNNRGVRNNRDGVTNQRGQARNNRGVNNNRNVRNNRNVSNNRGFRNNRNVRSNRGFRNNRRYNNNNQYFFNGRFHNRWRNDWRSSNRYNFRSYRKRNSSIFRLGFYSSPFRSHRYTRFGIGGYLGSAFFHSNYWITNSSYYRLPPAYGAYRWVRYYNDIFLVDIRNGYISDVEYGFFY